MSITRVKFSNEGVTLSLGLKDKEGNAVPITTLTNIVCEVRKYQTEDPKLEYALDNSGEYEDMKPLETFDNDFYARLVVEPEDMDTLPYGLIIIRVTYWYPDERFASGQRPVTKKGYLWHLKELI